MLVSIDGGAAMSDILTETVCRMIASFLTTAVSVSHGSLSTFLSHVIRFTTFPVAANKFNDDFGRPKPILRKFRSRHIILI